MISPTSPRSTASGLQATKVRSVIAPEGVRRRHRTPNALLGTAVGCFRCAAVPRTLPLGVSGDDVERQDGEENGAGGERDRRKALEVVPPDHGFDRDDGDDGP